MDERLMRMMEKLSTPHGALGTHLPNVDELLRVQLSTPHGALGTEKAKREEEERKRTFNSTRCIRNG